jgi:hypothetical protein
VPAVKLPFTGGCACGAIRYEVSAQPLDMFFCRCRDCQRASGGAGACAVVVPAASFKFTKGAPRYHCTQNLAGQQHQRGFCAECGSRLTGAQNPEGTSPFVGINAGSLDDPSWFQPRYEIFSEDAYAWAHPSPDLPKYEQYKSH